MSSGPYGPIFYFYHRLCHALLNIPCRDTAEL